jgi:hypothetical protein
MIGAFLAAMAGKRISSAWLNEALGLTGLGLILFSVFYYTRETRFPGVAAIPPCLGAALIIVSGGARATMTGKLLSLRPVVFIGLISYSIYLWHWPLLVFSRYMSMGEQSWSLRLGLLLASVALAMLSWKYVETPFRKRLICRRRPQVFALAAGAMMALLICGAGVCYTRGVVSWMPAQATKYSEYKNDRAFRNQISLKQAAGGEFAELGGQSASKPIEVLIWGDSHAMAITPVLDELCKRFSVRGLEATHASTAPLLGYVSKGTYALNEQSPTFSKSVFDFIAQRHIKTVILAAYWAEYGPPDLLIANLAKTVRALMDCGVKVYVVKDVPSPGFDVPRCAALTVLRHGELGKLAFSPEKFRSVDNDYEPVFEHISKMGATVLDAPRYFLNTNGLYDVIRDDKPLYWDSQHLSIEGSRVLTPMFEPLFSSK